MRRDIVKRLIRRILSEALESKALALNTQNLKPIAFQLHETRMSRLAAARPDARLRGKVAFVSGAASGIGRSIAILFARHGAKVVVADIDESGGIETVRQINAAAGTGVFIPTDVTSDASIQEAASRTVDLYHAIHILINNAGAIVEGSVLTLSPERWQYAIDLNLTSAYRCCRIVVPHIISAGGGSIVNMASVQGVAGFENASAYAAAKGGLISLTRQLASQFASDRIRVNSVSPGVLLTPIFDGMDYRDGLFAAVSAYAPLGHIGVPEDVAFACLFLASDESSYLTGGNLVIDGGMTMRGGL